MVMKAARGRVVDRKEGGDRRPKYEEEDSPRDSLRPLKGEAEGESNPDELIMVMMPRNTWDAFMALAEKNGGTAAQAMSTALKLLEKALEEVEKS